MSNDPKIFVIVPCYNEARVIASTVRSLLNYNYHVVIVDDASCDNCREEIQNLPVYYLRHQVNLGQGAAIQTGIDFAVKRGADYLATFDADGQHEVKDIDKLLYQLQQQKLDFVFGSRFLKGSSTNITFIRKALLYFSRIINFFISGVLLSDTNNGLRVFTADAAGKIRLKENRRTHSSDFIYQVVKNKLQYEEFPVDIHYSDYSRSKGIQNREGFSIFVNMLLFKFFK